MKALNKDTRGFVSGILEYLRHEGKGMHAVPKVQNLLHKVTTNAKKEKQAVVWSAVKLTAAEEQAIAHALSHIVGHEVSLDCRINTDLIAGLRIQMADWVVDTSFRDQIAQMASIIM
jgi:F-type H+-transporting ATPase subunit delta